EGGGGGGEGGRGDGGARGGGAGGLLGAGGEDRPADRAPQRLAPTTVDWARGVADQARWRPNDINFGWDARCLSASVVGARDPSRAARPARGREAVPPRGSTATRRLSPLHPECLLHQPAWPALAPRRSSHRR